jgi:hypothetical protein
LNRSSLDSVQSELSGALKILNEDLESAKSDTLTGLAALAEKITFEQESAIKSLNDLIKDVQDKLEIQIGENKVAIDATNTALASTLESATEMCTTAKDEAAEKLKSFASNLSQDLSIATDEIGVQILEIRRSLQQIDSDSKSAIEDGKSSLTAAFNKADELIQLSNSESRKEVSFLGETIGKELASVIVTVDSKVSTVKSELQTQIENSNSSFQCIIEELQSRLDTLHMTHENTDCQVKDLERLLSEMRIDQSSAVRTLTENIENIQGNFQNLKCESQMSIDVIKGDTARWQLESREAAEAAKSHLSADLNLYSKEIRAEHAIAMSEMKCHISDVRSEVVSSHSALQILINKTEFDVLSLGKTVETYLESTKTEAVYQTTSLKELLKSEVDDVLEFAKSNVSRMDGRFQTFHESINKLQESIASKIQITEQETTSRLATVKLEQAKEMDDHFQAFRKELIEATSACESKIADIQKDHQESSKIQHGEIGKVSDELQSQQIILQIQMEEVKIKSSEAVSDLENIVIALKLEFTTEYARLNECMARINSDSDKLNGLLESTRGELQLQLDANRELVEEAAAASMAVNPATVEQIEHSKEICLLGLSSQNDLLCRKMASDLDVLKADTYSEISKHRDSIKKDMEMSKVALGELSILKDKLEELTGGTILELEFMGKNIRAELVASNQAIDERIMQAKQEMQAQVDLALLASNETMEHNRSGLFEIRKLISDNLESAQAEWAKDFHQINEESKLLCAALKIDVDDKVRHSCKEWNVALNHSNQRIQDVIADLESIKTATESACLEKMSDTISTISKIQDSIASFDTRSDAMNSRLVQVEESISKSAQSFSEFGETASRDVSALSNKVSALQEQHTFCLTEMMQDKQELSEVQLNLSKFGADQTDLISKMNDVSSKSEILTGQVSSMEEHIQALAKVEGKSSLVEAMEKNSTDILQLKGLQEQMKDLCTKIHADQKHAQSDSNDQRGLIDEIEKIKKAVADIQSQHVKEMIGDRQEIIETQFAVSQLQGAVSQIDKEINLLESIQRMEAGSSTGTKLSLQDGSTNAVGSAFTHLEAGPGYHHAPLYIPQSEFGKIITAEISALFARSFTPYKVSIEELISSVCQRLECVQSAVSRFDCSEKSGNDSMKSCGSDCCLYLIKILIN